MTIVLHRLVSSAVTGCYRKRLWHISPLARRWFHTTALCHLYSVVPTGLSHQTSPGLAGGQAPHYPRRDALTTEQVQGEGAVSHIKGFKQHKQAQAPMEQCRFTPAKAEIGLENKTKQPKNPTNHPCLSCTTHGSPNPETTCCQYLDTTTGP